MTLRKYINPAFLLVFFIGLGHLFGVLNTFHRAPSTADIYPNLVAVMFSAFGLLYWYMNNTNKQWSVSTLAWLLVLCVVAIQPITNTIEYPDGMIFDLSTLLLCVAISLCLANVPLQYRKNIFDILVYFLIMTALLTVLTQLAQHLKLDLPRAILFPNFSETRISGNLSQSNQAAFTVSLGIVGILYLLSSTQRLVVKLLLYTAIVLLALGLSMTASRTGVILVIAALIGYGVLFRLPLWHKLMIGGSAVILLVVGFIAGSQLLKDYSSLAESSVERISDGSLSLRWYQLQQAIIMFGDHKLTGVGWGNLMGSSVDYAQVLPWFTTTAHTHLFISQIAVETGIIGVIALLPFAYILIKNFRLKQDNYQAAIYIMLAIFVLYSSSEFPLWLPKYLIVFVLLLSLIDYRSYSFSAGVKPLVRASMLVFSILLILGSIYYQVQYRHYSKVFYAITSNEFTHEQKIAKITNLDPVFGFAQFDDLFLFYLMSEDRVGLEHKTQLADKVLSQSVSYLVLTKSANIHLLAGNRQRALTLLQAACVFDNAQNCPDLAKQLNKNAGLGDKEIEWVNTLFQEWRQSNPQKTGLETITQT